MTLSLTLLIDLLPLKKHFHFQVKDHLVSQFFIWAGTNTTAISCTSLTPVETMVAGRLLALETIVL